MKSDNFFWNEQLGRGAFGDVFKGIRKKDGLEVAIKVFTKELYKKEIDEFKKISKEGHENIIQFIAEEAYESKKVIVMELCNGGSLKTFLMLSENSNGLPDEEFKLVLKDLTGGMKYLRSIDYIHRDLKPDNILRFIDDAGKTSVYKLTDFGTSRELGDEEMHETICGTPKYLHPHILENYIASKMNKQKTHSFESNTDLWSIGVTLYNAATSCLPFVFKSIQTLLTILDKKPQGCISAIEESTESIKYYETLSPTCLLSEEMKEYITPLLRDLLTLKTLENFTFQSYFERVEEILNKKAVHIFNVNKYNVFKVYLDETRFKTLREKLNEKLIIQTENYLIFNPTYSLWPLTDETNPEWLITTMQKPLFLFQMELMMDIDMRDLEMKDLNDSENSEVNERSIWEYCISISEIKRKIESHLIACASMIDFVIFFIKYLPCEETAMQENISFCELLKDLTEVSNHFRKASEKAPYKNIMYDCLKQNNNWCLEFKERSHSILEKLNADASTLNKLLGRCQRDTERIKSLPTHFSNNLKEEQEESKIEIIYTARAIVEQLHDSYKSYNRDSVEKNVSKWVQNAIKIYKHKLSMENVKCNIICEFESLKDLIKMWEDNQKEQNEKIKLIKEMILNQKLWNDQ